MKRFLAAVIALTFGAATLSAQAQDYERRRDHRNHNQSGQEHGRSGEHNRQHDGGGRGRRNEPAVVNQTIVVPQVVQDRGDHRGRGGDNHRGDGRGRDDYNRRGNDNQGRGDYRGNDNQGRHNRGDDHRRYDNHGRNDHRGNNRGWDRNDNRWSQRGWNRGDWRRSWNHGWSGSRYRSTSRYYYPRGYSSRHWSIGVRLPSVFYASSYYLNYSTYGLAPPPWGCQWVRVDADVMLVDLATGEVLDVLYGFYY